MEMVVAAQEILPESRRLLGLDWRLERLQVSLHHSKH